MSYWVNTFLFAFLSPLAISATLGVGLFLFVFPPFVLAAPLCLYFLPRCWRKYSLKGDLPTDPFVRYSPIFAAFAYYMLVWIVTFLVSADFRTLGDTFPPDIFRKLTLPFFIFNEMFAGPEYATWFPFVVFLTYLLVFLTFAAGSCISEGTPTAKRRLGLSALSVTALCAVAIFLDIGHREVLAELRSNVIRQDRSIMNVRSEEVDRRAYLPFKADNKLQRLDEEPTLVIASGYPKLDGATSAVPIYCAVAETLYEGLNEHTVTSHVGFSTTAQAYERLVRGETDIFFGLQPSPQQVEAAERNGARLTLTPIARDGFVFFVNAENPVDSLTLDQIRDIYTKKIVSWDIVGGRAERILPFQRQEGSGSQTTMTALVMQDKPLPPPLVEERLRGMGYTVARVAADYRNDAPSIGYSFRYYVAEMDPNKHPEFMTTEYREWLIKFLAIDGVEPTPGNIRAETYPLTVSVYAVTTDLAERRNENVRKLIDWCLTDQGQRLIERSGYVGL